MPNKIYVNPGTTLSFDGTAGANVAFSVENIATNTGWVSARYDRGIGAQPSIYEWRSSIQWQGSPTKGNGMHFYLAASDGTNVDGDVGTADLALGSEDQLVNLIPIGMVVVETSGTTKMVASGRFTCTSRYMSMVAFNRGGTTTNITDSNFTFEVTPIPPEIQ